MANLIIAVGGTGKSVALVYRRMARFFGRPDEVLVIDMPFGSEPIDNKLDEEGVSQENFIPPWPGGDRDISGITFAEMIGFNSGAVARPVAHALFTRSELGTLVATGMNARPIVGATVAMQKFWGDVKDSHLNDLKSKIGKYSDIFVVGSITGGTGSGILPTLGRWLTEVCDKRVHGLLFLPWISIKGGGNNAPDDARLHANAHAVLTYLKQIDPATNTLASGPAPFGDYVILGNPEEIDPGSDATSASHPLHLAAATYLLYFNVIRNKNPQERAGPFYLEVTAGGLRASDVKPIKDASAKDPQLNLEQAINRQFWYDKVLQNMAGQKPDQSWDLNAPPLAANWLAWRALRESVRGLALRAEGRGARTKIWEAMRAYFREEAKKASTRIAQFGSIISRDTRHLVYNVSLEELEEQAKGFERRAHRTASGVDVPNFDENVPWQDAAKAVAAKLALDTFDKLGKLATDRITGGKPAAAAQGSSTVFLPSGVQLPKGGLKDIERHKLNAFEALIQKYSGAIEAINMPDPQARRYQFEDILGRTLADYVNTRREKSVWDATEPLAQFTALLEGVIFGRLRIKLFDLLSFGFQSPRFDRRILGVLVDDEDNVYGGTDPETLFFPAPESWDSARGVLRHLSNENATRRDSETGKYARELLRKFRATFSGEGHPLWMRAVDEYLNIYNPHLVDADDDRLRAGWKQAGPIQLRLPDGSVDARYIPTYEADFASRAVNAMSGEFVLRDADLQLKVNGGEAGSVCYPKKISAGLTLRLMGAGAITLSSSGGHAGGSPLHINYEGLKDKCQVLIGDGQAPASVGDVRGNPFKYPDVIRLPFQQDGYIAEYFLRGGRENERYGRKFLNSVRGRAVSTLPGPPEGQQLPQTVSDGQSYHYVDSTRAVYVEKYEGQFIRELSLIGQALWAVFCGEARPTQNGLGYEDDRGLVLGYADQRFFPGPAVVLSPPKRDMRAADLRSLCHYAKYAGTDRLFREAVGCWLKHFDLDLPPADDRRTPEDIVGRRWWRP